MNQQPTMQNDENLIAKETISDNPTMHAYFHNVYPVSFFMCWHNQNETKNSV